MDTDPAHRTVSFSSRSHHNRTSCSRRSRSHIDKLRIYRSAVQLFQACRSTDPSRCCTRNCRSQRDRTCSSRNHLRSQYSRIHFGIRCSSFQPRSVCSRNHPTLDRTPKFRLMSEPFPAGNMSRHRMSHEARRTDRRNDLEDIRRSGRRQYCECI